eukprot:TRINITY_DN13212_c0_g1_i1.p1 TRINITY_DN13212_c0_g1~~TRINITY_DN13212_c0_g1_i1.p1  ORF type:complete len:103 (+),score=13.70 TRINITY_DN13212_c0_g1_i1:84-392(+)
MAISRRAEVTCIRKQIKKKKRNNSRLNSKVRRSLFGQFSRSEIEEDIQKLCAETQIIQRQEAKRLSLRLNFDLETETPMAGDFLWQRVNNKDEQETTSRSFN